MSQELLRELAIAKATFQLRTLEMILRGPAQVDRSPEGQDRNGLDAKHESAAPKGCVQGDAA